ncbi:MAG: hypothetical protein QM504_07680, partial [Pseudomonadota bacterium]
MSLKVIYGKPRNIIAIKEIINELETRQINGTFYIGYPTLPSENNSITVDALLIADEIGLVVFHIPQSQQFDLTDSNKLSKLQEAQDHIFNVVESYLSGYPKELKKGRKLVVNINVVSYFHDGNINLDAPEIIVATK